MDDDVQQAVLPVVIRVSNATMRRLGEYAKANEWQNGCAHSQVEAFVSGAIHTLLKDRVSAVDEYQVEDDVHADIGLADFDTFLDAIKGAVVQYQVELLLKPVTYTVEASDQDDAIEKVREMYWDGDLDRPEITYSTATLVPKAS